MTRSLFAIVLALACSAAQAEPKYALRRSDCGGPKCEDITTVARMTKAQCEMVLKICIDNNPANPRHFRCEVSDDAMSPTAPITPSQPPVPSSGI